MWQQHPSRILCTLMIWVMSLGGLSCQQLDQAKTQTTVREAEGLHGPVRSIEVVHAVLVKKDGEWNIGTQKYIHKATYDRQGRKTEQTVYTNDGHIHEIIHFSYDDRGHETQARHVESSGQLTSRVLSSYDEIGRRVEATTYTAANEPTHRVVFSYDDAGNEISTQRYATNETLSHRTTSAYDTQGNQIQKKWYEVQDTPIRIRTAKYDYLGALVSDTLFEYAADGTLTSRTDTRYDPQGNPQSEVVHREDGQFKRERSFTYQSDAFGNWTLQTVSTRLLRGESPSFEPPIVISRTLSYYGRGAEEVEAGSE